MLFESIWKLINWVSLPPGIKDSIKNKKGNIKIDTTGNITLKGMGSDVHTLLKKLSMALQNMTHPTPAGPSGVATNMSEIMQFDAEIDKVFQPWVKKKKKLF